MTRVSWCLLALVTAGATRAVGQSPCSVTLYGKWELRFAAGALTHQATLKMNGCTGVMEVGFYNQRTQRREDISQRVSVVQSSQGVLLRGARPVYRGTTQSHPTYAADNLLYAVDPNGL